MGGTVLRIAWSTDDGRFGEAALEPGAKLVLARRMGLPEAEPFVVEEIGGSVYVFVRLPYVSDPALVVQATDGHPVLHRGQRANGAIVELTLPTGETSTPAPGQRLSVTSSGTRVDLRFPGLAFGAVLSFDAHAPAVDGSGTVQLGVAALQHDDAWLVGALAVALSPDNGVVGHADLKRAFADWRGTEVPSDGSFDRNVLRPALERRAVELPGPRLNKILYLVERCRRTSEFPPHVLREVRERLG